MTWAWLCYKNATIWNELVINVLTLESEIELRQLKGTTSDMIRYHRIRLGWSQYKLAQELGLSKKQGRYLLKDYETRGIFPSKELSMKLAIVFGLNTTYFYDDYFMFLDNSISIVQNLRMKNNLSIKEISEKFEVTPSTWSRWEKGFKIDRKNYENLKPEIHD